MVAAARNSWAGTPRVGNVNALSAPGERWVAITPNDGVDLVEVPRAIYSHDGGAIQLVHATDLTGVGLPFIFAAGEMKALQPVRVKAAGTASTVIYAIY